MAESPHDFEDQQPARPVQREAYSPAEVAIAIGLPVRSVQELCRNETLPAVRIGERQYRVPAWGLRSWLARESGCQMPEGYSPWR